MTDTALPRWDVSDLFPGVDSRQLTDALEQARADLTRLVALYDEHGVREVPPHPPSPAEVAALDDVLDATNRASEQLMLLRAYITSFVATDSFDAAAQAAYSRLLQDDATLRALSARLAPWVRALGPDELAAASPAASDHAFPLTRLAERATHQMDEGQEALYAQLSLTGSTAWQRLHSDLTSQLEATVPLPGQRLERLPIAAVRGLATDPDEAVRRAAYDAELDAWPTVAVACAAALNAIKGEADVVNTRRGWEDALEASLFANAVDRASFDAMQAAVTATLPDFRRWLRAKAAAHGHTGALPWWDLFAPLPAIAGAVSWDEGTQQVRRAFATYGDGLDALAERALRERWVDAEPRNGKRGGAFCMPVGQDRSLVMLNWSGSFDSVQTLAHELGHAYHNVQLAGRTPLQRQLTMALAETASIFCETIVVEAGLRAASPTERLVLLDTDLQGSTQVVVDIRSRFLFEREVFRRRRAGTLSVGELCDLMHAGQLEAYGDGVEEATLHPWMWAVKPHYYGSHFYNWPYTFGLLFGLLLVTRFEDDPDRFRSRYDDVLSRVGLADANALAREFGIDLHDEAVWHGALGRIVARIDEYERLMAEFTASAP